MNAPTEALAEAALTSARALPPATLAELDEPLDFLRVKKKPGSNKDYLAEHDVIRTANRIFGYGQWGVEVVDLTLVGSHEMKNGKGEDGWYTGYRCTVALTVTGCETVTGVGYGDAFEKQWSAQVTTHELAAKEAESDAIKRAFKKWGDQFGLILYAKDDERARLQAEAEARSETPEAKKAAVVAAWAENDDRPATDDEIAHVTGMAPEGSELRDVTEGAIEAHRLKTGVGLVSSAWIGKLATGLAAKLSESTSPFTVPAGVQAAEPQTELPAADASAVREAFKEAA